jgi:alpha-D-ribose 1-methylphosphonate 5-triphosphate synthase subunit PhnI
MEFTGKYAKRRSEIFDQILRGYDDKLKNDPAFLTALRQFSNITEECERLQEFIDDEGMTCEHMSAAGNLIVKSRPEIQILRQSQTMLFRERDRLQKLVRMDEEKDDKMNLLA